VRRNWQQDLADLRNQVGDFNIKNYVTKVLTKEEQSKFNQICLKIPKESRVYMQYSLRKQFKQIKEAYEKWLELCIKNEGETDLPDI